MPIGPSVGVVKVKNPKISVDTNAVKKIVISPCNLFFLLENGELYGCGSNNTLQFGSGLIDNGSGHIVNYPDIPANSYDVTFQRYSTKLANPNKMGYIGIIRSFPSAYNTSRNTLTGYTFGGATTDPYSSNTFLKTVISRTLPDYSFIDLDITELDDRYGSSVLGIDKNNILYVWGQSNNNVFGKYSETNNYTFLDANGYQPGRSYNIQLLDTDTTTQSLLPSISLENFRLRNIIDKPKKISDEKWNSVVANNVLSGFKHILLKGDNTIYVLGKDNGDITQLGNNNNWKYIAYDYAINNNNELYRLSSPFTYEVVTPNQFMGLGTKLGNGNSTTINPLTSLTFPEKIKNIYDSLSSDDVLFLSETGKVSGIGANLGVMGNASMNQYRLFDIPRNDYTAIKDIIITNYNSVFAQTTDNSLLAWGANSSGQLGYGNNTSPYKTPVSKITNISGIVSGVYPSFHTNFYTLVLGTNTRLSATGSNTNGVLGTGDTTNKNTFTQVLGVSGIKDVINNSSWNYVLGNNKLLSGWGTGANLGILPLLTITPPRLSVEPNGIGVDSNDNIFVALNNTILKINTNNVATSFASVGTSLEGLVIDRTNNNIYVVNNSFGRVHKVTSAGNNSEYFNIDSTSNSYSPYGITLLNRSNATVLGATANFQVFVTVDYGMEQIAGDPSTYSTDVLSPAGKTNGEAIGPSINRAKVNYPKGLHYDTGDDFIYMADTTNNRIIKIKTATSPYSVTTILSTGLSEPYDVVTDTNNVYITDKNNHCIKSVPKNGGTVTVIAGLEGTSGFANGTGTTARFKNPTYLTHKGTFLYVSDSGNFSIRKINTTNNSVSTIIGDGTSGSNFNELSTYSYPNQLSARQIPFVNNINKVFASKSNNTIYTLGANKEVSAWGSNIFGQLGINTTQTSVPTATKFPLSNIQDIVITYNPTTTNTNPTVYENPTVYFLDESGGLSGCGFNGNGNLGFVSTGPAVSAVTKINVPPVRKLYSDAQGFVYAIGTNNELSGWGRTATYTFIPKTNNIAPIYRFSQLSNVDYLVVNDSNIDFTTGRMACVVGLNQKLTAWGGTGMIFSNTNPTEVSNVKSVSSIFINYKSNNVFINGAYYEIKPDRDYTTQQKIGVNDWKIVDKHGDFAIKLDNTLWSISSTPFQIGTDNNYESVYYETPVKFTDNLSTIIDIPSSSNVDKIFYRISTNRSTGKLSLSTNMTFLLTNSDKCFDFFTKKTNISYGDYRKTNIRW